MDKAKGSYERLEKLLKVEFQYFNVANSKLIDFILKKGNVLQLLYIWDEAFNNFEEAENIAYIQIKIGW